MKSLKEISLVYLEVEKNLLLYFTNKAKHVHVKVFYQMI